MVHARSRRVSRVSAKLGQSGGSRTAQSRSYCCDVGCHPRRIWGTRPSCRSSRRFRDCAIRSCASRMLQTGPSVTYAPATESTWKFQAKRKAQSQVRRLGGSIPKQQSEALQTEELMHCSCETWSRKRKEVLYSFSNKVKWNTISSIYFVLTSAALRPVGDTHHNRTHDQPTDNLEEPLYLNPRVIRLRNPEP